MELQVVILQQVVDLRVMMGIVRVVSVVRVVKVMSLIVELVGITVTVDQVLLQRHVMKEVVISPDA